MKRTILILLLYHCLVGQVRAATLSGTVTDNKNGESLPYANVVLKWDGEPMGALSNVDGYYAVKNIDPGEYVLVVSYVGYKSLIDTLDFRGKEEVVKDVALGLEPFLTQEIVVEADRFEDERVVQTGFIAVETRQLQQLPAIGETDILRGLQLLPGIQAASDISSGLYIRGGGPDQTLILLDQIPLYNPSHAFGFFSTFNPDAIKDMSLHKGAYPAQYGGRLGSVLDVRNRDGNRKGFEATGGVSLISARLTLEGPVNKGSWMISGRRTYLEPILSAIRNDSTEVPHYFFYDTNAKFNVDFSDRNKMTFSGYFGRDDMRFDLDEGSFINIRWGNTAFTGKWTHVFTPALFGNFMVASSKYTSSTSLSFFETPIEFSNSIQDVSIKGDLDFFASSHHSLNSGFLATWYDFTLKQSFNRDEQLNLTEKPFLLSAYFQDLWQIRPSTSFRLGARTDYFSEGKRLHFEPRIALSHQLNPEVRAKLGGGYYHQYLQLVTTEAFSGGDFWVPLDHTVDSGRSWQGAMGLEWEPSRRYQVSVEGYYRDMENLVVLDNRVAGDTDDTTSEDIFVSGGKGFATGIELFLQRRTGALTGWVGYTLAWTRRTFKELNQGKQFPPKYDRRNDLSFVTNYQVGRWSFGANLVYGTGQAFTPASGRYFLRSPATGIFEQRVLPADRNSARLLPYHRMDLSIKRKIGIFGSDAEVYLQAFNVYNRRNEWFITYDPDDNGAGPDVIRMLPIVPTFGINFNF
jgi:outer membrane cobalamin receptor